MIGVSDEPEGTIRKFAESRNIGYPLVSGKNWGAPFDKIKSYPTTFTIDRSGVIQHVFVGARNYQVFRDAVDSLAELERCTQLVERQEFKAAAEALREIATKSSSRQEKQRLFLSAAVAYLADGSEESIASSREILLSRDSMKPGNKKWNLTFAAWLLKSDKSGRAVALKAADNWFRSSRRTTMGSWLSGWILSMDTQYDEAERLLAQTAFSPSVDPYDHMFHAMALSGSGKQAEALTYTQNARKKLQQTYGSPNEIANRVWHERICLEVIVEQLDSLADK